MRARTSGSATRHHPLPSLVARPSRPPTPRAADHRGKATVKPPPPRYPLAMAVAETGAAPMRARYGRDVTTFGHAFREFRSNRSPWIIGAGILAAAGARIVVGGFSWRDVVAAAAMLVIYPFG